ncbi:Nuclease SbcCD subunit C [Elizabethkingia miricola]|nr:Nuclease SbcCD subunit C [Elizabethkingia miricola]
MKILAIQIKNLASLENAEIDFTLEPLCSAGIFAITGPTGAGKSTILDALCLALYAKTPRYRTAENGIDITDVKGNTIKQDDVRGILRDGTSNGYAEVDFVGIDGHHYATSWRVRRAHNKADGSLQNYEMTLKNITTGQSIPGKKTELLVEIERLVGLNFEQFTRSVLLAQGDFTAFLKAGKDEKSSLLEKLTGTHIYSEISKSIFENHREQQQNLRDLTIRCEGILTLTSEELNALLERKVILETSVKSEEQKIEDLNKEIHWHEQLIKIQDGVASAKQQYNLTNNDKTDALPREQKLNQIISLQPAKPLINSLNEVQNQLVVKSKLSKQLDSDLLSLQKQKKVLEDTLEDALNELNKKIKEEEDAQPLLNEAKSLDAKLSEKTVQVKKAAEEVETAQNKQEQHRERLSQIKKKSDLIDQKIIILNQWKTDNEKHQSITEQENVILSKLKDAESILKNLNIYNSRIQNAEKEIENQQQRKQELEIESQSHQKSILLLQTENDAVEKLLSSITIHDIEKDKATTDSSIEDIVSATAHWKLLYNAINQEELLKKSVEQNKTDQEQQTEKWIEAEKLLETKKSVRDISLKILENTRLTATKNVEDLRNQLKSEEPCPVCGSTTHPYTIYNPSLNLVLSEIEKEYRQAEENYEKHISLCSTLKQSAIQAEQTITKLETEISQKKVTIQELQCVWSEFHIYEKCEEQLFEERTNWLQKQLLEQKDKQVNLAQQIQLYNKQKQQLETHRISFAEFSKKLTDTENNIKDVERKLKSLEEQKINDSGEQEKERNKLEDMKQSLTVHFESQQWFQNWQANPEEFAKRIKKFALEWNDNSKKLDENTLEKNILFEKLKGIQEQSSNIDDELKLKEQDLTLIRSQETELLTKRKTIFKGESTDTVEKGLKEAVNTSRQTLEQKKKDTESIQSNITRAIAQIEHLEKDKTSLLERENKLKKEFGDWLSSYNHQHQIKITADELLPLLELTQAWIENEIKSLRAIDDLLMQAKSILTERNTALETHTTQQVSEKTWEELIQLQTEVLASSKQNFQAITEIGFRIKEDESNKSRIGHLLQDIEKQSLIVDNWAKLNDIIGSADGKKFRQIAQEYTLDVLLSYANIHLEALNKRYVLERIPNSLGLQVIDQDMGDEIRTIYSLSGGESFLVSLALALGLASLSSNRMTVESLFIDEGFGSLDPTTLNIAMDALERLQNQGRKVGVISHVQEMTERIPVQIKVSKQQSGKSKVEIIQ